MGIATILTADCKWDCIQIYKTVVDSDDSEVKKAQLSLSSLVEILSMSVTANA